MQTMYQSLNRLYSHAKEHMTPAELDTLADDMLEQAVNMSQDMSAFLEGTACLISNEERAHAEGVITSGSLQSRDSIFQMLCMTASKFDLIAGMIEVGSEAKFKANQKRQTNGAPSHAGEKVEQKSPIKGRAGTVNNAISGA